jgi:hypothetical protein
MTIDISSHHILVAVLPTIHRDIIRAMVLNMVKAVKFIFKLIFSFLGLAMTTSLPIARYLIILLLVHPDADLPNAVSLEWCKLLLVVSVRSPHDHLLLLPATSSFVHVLLLLLMVDVTADTYLLLGDLWELQEA